MRSFVSFLSGIAVGAVLGILYAPDTGKNTRERLSNQLDQYLRKLRQAIDDGQAGPEQSAAGAGAPSTTDLSRNDRRRAEELLREVETMLDDLKASPNG
jgi:gas vesicle protein